MFSVKQIPLFAARKGTEHGGSVRKKQRKLARPIDTKRPMHLTFSSKRAVGQWSFHRRRHAEGIEESLHFCAKRFGIRVMRFENVGNHLHVLIQGRSRRAIQAFLKVFAQKVMFLVTGAKKGAPRGPFFDGIVHSRLVNWGRDLRGMKHYFFKNRLEAAGVPRERIDHCRTLLGRWRAYPAPP